MATAPMGSAAQAEINKQRPDPVEIAIVFISRSRFTLYLFRRWSATIATEDPPMMRPSRQMKVLLKYTPSPNIRRPGVQKRRYETANVTDGNLLPRCSRQAPKKQ